MSDAMQTGEVTVELLRRDATLPADLRASPVKASSPNVFLTGASGFVGAALLWEILQHSSGVVFCHVRAPSVAAAHQRLMSELAVLGPVPPAWQERIRPTPGDLAKPKLGMSERDYEAVAAHTGRIFHVGALVSHVAPYRVFRRPNVEATLEILRLSSAVAQKEIHHVSSLGYWSGYQQEVSASSRNTRGPSIQSPGYLLSKWASDRLMEQAADRGMPVAIYRLGYVSGGWRGSSNARGWLELHLRAFARLRAMPEGDTSLAITPVDLLASDIWTLSQMPEALGQSHNLAHREQVISTQEVERAFARLGCPVERLSGADWYALFMAAPHDGPMQLLEVFLEAPFPEFSPEGHAFARRASTRTDALLGHPPPFSMESYVDVMVGHLMAS